MKTEGPFRSWALLGCLLASAVMPASGVSADPPIPPQIKQPIKPPVRPPTIADVLPPPAAPKEPVAPKKIPAVVIPRISEPAPDSTGKPQTVKVPVTPAKTAKQPETARVPDSLRVGDEQIGAGRKIGDVKGGDILNKQIARPPSSDNKPPSQGKGPGGAEVSADPASRPNLSGFEKHLGNLEQIAPAQGDASHASKRGLKPPGSDAQQSPLQEAIGNHSKLTDPTESLLTDPTGGSDKRSRSEDSAVGADPGAGSTSSFTGTTLAPARVDNEGVHVSDGGRTAKDHEGTTLGQIGTAIGTGLPNTPTGKALKQAIDESDNQSKPGGDSTGNGSGSSGSGSAGNTEQKPKTTTNGTIISTTYPDGTKTVYDDNTKTTTTVYPDGSTKTTKPDEKGKEQVIDETHPSTSIPDEDHAGVPLPAQLQKQRAADLAALRAAHPKVDIHGEDPNRVDTTGAQGPAELPGSKKKGQLTNPGTADTTTPSASLNQQRMPQGPKPEVIHTE